MLKNREQGCIYNIVYFSGNKNFPHDIKTQSGLTTLFNERVISSQPVERPLKGPGGGKFGQGAIAAANFVGIKTSHSGKNDRATHSGSLVTTSDGKQYLVHKGDGFGKSSNTVVTDAKHMSSKWKPAGPTTNVAGRASISDFVKAGGKDYNVRGKNCHNATSKMQNLGK